MIASLKSSILHFREHARGLAIDSPVTRQPRVPGEVIKEIPELGVLSVRPAISSELERIPKHEDTLRTTANFSGSDHRALRWHL